MNPELLKRMEALRAHREEKGLNVGGRSFATKENRDFYIACKNGTATREMLHAARKAHPKLKL